MPPRPCHPALVACALLTLSAPLPLSAQPAYMVADLQTEPTRDQTYLIFTPRIVEAQGVGYFFHDDGVHGAEIWRTDGTGLGTFLLKDLCPGLCGARTLSGPEHMSAIGSHLLFSGNDGVHGTELWMTDGTAVGTALVRDIRPGADSSLISQMVTAGGQAFFIADDGVHGRELWRSDGTAKGTYLLKELTAGTLNNDVVYLFAGGGHLFFTLYGSASEPGLWSSDGTADGTERLAELSLAASGPYKGLALRFLPNGVLLFAASPMDSDAELWRSDGTPAGTYRVKDLFPGSEGSNPESFIAYGDEVVFEAASAADPLHRVLWRSDGTEPGTTEIPAPADFAPYLGLGVFATVGDRIFFPAFETATGLELWTFDGVDAHAVSDIRPGPDSSIDTFAGFAFNRAVFADVGGRLVFLADDGVNGLEFWTSDGFDSGTVRISDLFPGTLAPEFDLNAQMNPRTQLGDRLVLRAFDELQGYRLVASDGTAGGTSYLDTLSTTASSFLSLREPAFPYSQAGSQCAEAAADRLVFSTTSSPQGLDRFWGTDGSPEGTELLSEATPGNYQPSGCTSLADQVVFFADHGGLPALWSTMGTTESTLPLADLASEPTFADLRPYFVPFSDSAIFGAHGGLWRTTGTPETTELISALADFSWGGLASTDLPAIAYSDYELHFSDGVPGGLLIDIDLNGDQPSYPSDLTPLATNNLLFFAITEELGAELWKSDGTPKETHLVRDIGPGPKGHYEPGRPDLSDAGPEPHMVSLGWRAVLVADDGTTGGELWVTDGTLEGTNLLRDIYPGDYPSSPRHLTRFGDRVAFAAEDEAHGLELWVTDGTEDGTALLKDIAPGAASSSPDDIVVRNGVLYFSAWSPSYGREAWKSDGTTSGTVRITDVAPGPLSSSPQRFARAGDLLYFSATDQIHGYELWAMFDDSPFPLFLDGFETGDTVRWSAVEP